MTNSELQAIANRLRLDVVETVHLVGDGHPGPCMSIADLIAVLFFERMKLRPEDPDWQERDRFILSKGHACPILYAALARRGYFPLDELKHAGVDLTTPEPVDIALTKFEKVLDEAEKLAAELGK